MIECIHFKIEIPCNTKYMQYMNRRVQLLGSYLGELNGNPPLSLQR